MNKLRLDQLEVESFVVDERMGARGTVAGNELTVGCPTAEPCTEEYGSCDDVCGASHPYQKLCAPVTTRPCTDYGATSDC